MGNLGGGLKDRRGMGHRKNVERNKKRKNGFHKKVVKKVINCFTKLNNRAPFIVIIKNFILERRKIYVTFGLGFNELICSMKYLLKYYSYSSGYLHR